MSVLHFEIFIVICLLIALVLLGISFIFVRLNLKATKKSDKRSRPKTSETDLEIINKIRQERVREDALGEAFEGTMCPVYTESGDGIRLFGMVRKQDKPSHKWVISNHCFKSSYRYCLSYGKSFYDEGMNVLLPDLRGHGNSGGSYIGMGYLDRIDMKAWIDWILEKDPVAMIVLHGISMGAGVTMMAAGENFPGVVAYVEDCGYSSVWDIFSSEARKRYHIPAFPLLYMASFLSKLFVGYGFKEASCLKQVKKCKKPMLIIHGKEDSFVPASMGLEIYKMVPGDKDLYLVEHAGHCQARDLDSVEYQKRILEFFYKFHVFTEEEKNGL